MISMFLPSPHPLGASFRVLSQAGRSVSPNGGKRYRIRHHSAKRSSFNPCNESRNFDIYEAELCESRKLHP